MESSFIAEDPIDLPWNTLKVLTLNAASNESLNTRIQTTNGTPPPLERATLPHVIPGIGVRHSNNMYLSHKFLISH